MGYKTMFATDMEYMKAVNTFKHEKQELEKKVHNLNYSNAELESDLRALVDKTTASLKAIQDKRVEEAKEAIAFAQKPKDIGVALRPHEAKEFEVRFKLLSDQDLRHLASTRDSTDILELSLLRLELRIRGLEEADQEVSRYIAMNEIGGMNEADKSDHRHYSERLKNYSNVAPNQIVMDGSLQFLEHFKQDMTALIRNRAVQEA